MKLVANIKLLPTREQRKVLKATLERANEACNFLSQLGWDTGSLRQFDLHKIGYKDTRERFGLAAQVAVRCIAKVADAYKLDKKVQRKFRKHAAQPYDDRIISFKADDIVSIWTLDGRMKIKTAMGKHQRDLLAFRKGEVDLMLIKGQFYLACVCDIDDSDLIDVDEILGVDLGIVKVATDSDGRAFTGDRYAAILEVARQRLDYDPSSGEFSWNHSMPKQHAGKVAGKTDADGYIRIGINGLHYLAHRLAWTFAYGKPPTMQIDHINRDPSDNRIDNLRQATSSQNRINSSQRSDNTSGVRGVSFNKRRGKWQASISANGKAKHIGYFETISDAEIARRHAVDLLYGEFGRT